MTPPSRQPPAKFAVPVMQSLLDGEQAAIRQRVREILARPSFRYLPLDASIDDQRQAALRWCQELAAEGIGALALPKEYGGRDDFAAFMAAFETIAFHDLSLTIKFTVQFGLWLGSVLLLGTETQHRQFLRDIGTLALPGCFGMTEIGHGSNVRDLETIARYEPETGQFVITSPTFPSGKNYIGNAACHGRAATVFAQLETAGTRHGVHAFVVPLRDMAGQILPGVRIEDNGPKMGENGVDNGRIWFDDVRIDRDAMLNRFGQVAPDGTYSSEIRSDGARFFAMLSALVGGRISIAAAAISAAKSGLTIAVRYAARRRQFRLPGSEEETPLLNYPTHQRRLLPLLANSYALDFAHKYLVRKRLEAQGNCAPESAREVERLAAAVKAWASWNTTRTLQVCREACGGEGYIAANRLPALKADTDIFTTFEGDNTVLMVWVGRNLLTLPDSAAAEVNPEAVDLNRLFAAREDAMRAELRECGATPPQLALLRLANAYTERVLVQQFGAAVATVADSACRETLALLHELCALTLLEEQRGWFVERGLISAAVSKSLPEQVEALAAKVAPRAVDLVNAFGIPDQCLAAPIALP